jgi:hypothetical protein
MTDFQQNLLGLFNSFQQKSLIEQYEILLDHQLVAIRREIMNPCKVEGCGKTDDDRPMAFRGEPYCSDIHRKVLAGELKVEMVPTVMVPADVPKEVVE